MAGQLDAGAAALLGGLELPLRGLDALRRLLLRLWLQANDARPIHANLRRYYGADGMHAEQVA